MDCSYRALEVRGVGLSHSQDLGRWRRSGGGRAARTRERLRLTMARVLPAVGGAAHARGGEELRWGRESGERTPTHMSQFQNYGVHDLSLNLVFKIYHELPYFITIIPLI